MSSTPASDNPSPPQSHSPPAITIRPATLTDVPSIVSIGTSVFTSSFGHASTPAALKSYLSTAYSAASITADLLAPSKSTFVAVSPSDKVIGFALITRGDAPEEPSVAHLPSKLELQRIYVDAEWHSRGVGQKLFERVEQVAREEGVKAVWLGVWERNARGIKVYEKWGFEKVGTHGFVIGEDVHTDWMMVKMLEG